MKEGRRKFFGGFVGGHRKISTGFHPSKSTTTAMILTLFCHLLLLDMGASVAVPSPDPTIPSPTNLSRSRSPPPPSAILATPPSSASSSSLAHSPRRIRNNTRVTGQLLSTSSSPLPSRPRPTYRRRRDPKSQPQESSDWLIPPFSPSPTPRSAGVRSGSGNYNGNSNGLAYRSILPIGGGNSNGNHYTGLYRNRNLFSNGEVNEQDWNYNYNYNANNPTDYGKGVSPQDKNDIGVNLAPEDDGGRGRNNLVNPTNNGFTTLASTIRTTVESKTKSAPATEAGSVSSTLEMSPEFGGGGGLDLISRDAIGGQDSLGLVPGESKMRQGKIAKSEPEVEQEQDSSIVFPGSVYRPPNKRPGSVRPGKATPSSDSDDYVPPPLKALDKAAFESLKMLLETRRISQTLNSRASNPKIGGSGGNMNPATAKTTPPPPTSPLDIKGRPKCATQNSGYCDEIDTYPKDFFNQVLKNSLTLTPQVFQEVFGDSIDNKTVASDLAGRDGLNLMLDSPLCSSIEHTIYPKVAENKDGKFMYIVNHDEYIQGVRVEKCVKEGSACMYLEGSLTGYQSACRQKYIYRKLLAFTRDGKATTDTFRLPACCVCHVRSVFVDDRINTAGFGSDADYPPATMVMPKTNNSTQGDLNINNGTLVEIAEFDDRFSDSVVTATESHVEDYPTVLPDAADVEFPKNESGPIATEVTGVLGFRTF